MTPRRLWLAAVLVLYLALTCYQLGLPGLHYDEAKEAGVNAMQILTGAPISAFRDAGIVVGGRTYPLMVQDYIGALDVYLALPFLALTGIGVPNLRLVGVLTGLVALVLIERAVSEWVASGEWRVASQDSPLATRHSPLTISGLLTITLLAASPSYVFWARQGIFVTNLMLPFTFLCIWQGVRWLHTGRATALVLAALAGGLALYAKLLAIWVVGPFALLAGGWWLWRRLRQPEHTPALAPATFIAALFAFLLPLTPLVVFNVQTAGTLARVGGSLGQSYYGVNNADVLANLPVRWHQLGQVLSGDVFWYLGGVFTNPLAPWLAIAALAAGLWRNWRRVLPPLLLLSGALACSLFTISDLFVTHFALIQPLAVAAVGIALGSWVEDDGRLRGGKDEGEGGHAKRSRLAVFTRSPAHLATLVVLILWLALDLTASLRYHAALGHSGGLADHSDASYHLAYHLRYNGFGAPIVLDWGIDAPVRYLTEGTVVARRDLRLRFTRRAGQQFRGTVG